MSETPSDVIFNGDTSCRSNNAHRPYDRFMGSRALKKAHKLRINPDGACHSVKWKTISTGIIPIYPWKKMLLGDYFLVPIRDKSTSSMKVAMLQAAARYDYELSVVRAFDSKKVPCLRVTLSAIGVRIARWRAFQEGYLAKPPSPGTDKVRAAAAQRRRYAITGDEARKARRQKAKSIIGDPRYDPFYLDSQSEQANPAKPEPVHNIEGNPVHTDSTMTREEKLRLILSKADSQQS